MGFGFSPIRSAASALTAERLRMDIVSDNLANIDTTRTPTGGPYRRRFVVFEPIVEESGNVDGVRVSAIVEDNRPPRMVYDPNHPDANAQGYVAYPRIDFATEIVDLMAAQRAYEANTTTISIARSMYLKTLEIGR